MVQEVLSWLAGCVLLGCAFGYALAQSHPAVNDAGFGLTLEDLQEALERGDLSDREFQDLADRVAARLLLDSLEETSLRARLMTTEAVEITGTGPSASHDESGNMTVSLQTAFPVRGFGTSTRTVHGQIARGQQSVAIAAGRSGTRGWHMRRLAIDVERGPLHARVGSIETRWTGGLLIGPAPRFIRPDARQSLLQGYDARLSGIECSWETDPVTIQLLTSHRYDSNWSHRVHGVQLRGRAGSVRVEPAYLWQVVDGLRSPGEFESGVLGVSLGRTATDRRWQIDAAASGHGAALQGEMSAALSSGVRWRMSAWRISTGFRHPLLGARGESDRELIDYPELGSMFSTASTGERGGEGRLTLGSRRRRGEIRATWWREWPGRGASLRTAIRYRHGPGHSARSLSYAMQSRVIEARAFRHELTAAVRSAGWWYRARVRHVHGRWSPFSAWSGDCRIGHDFPVDAYGDLSLSLTLESYDWSAWHHGFLVFRLDHEVKMSGGTVGLYARWRLRHDERPAALSMRFSSVLAL